MTFYFTIYNKIFRHIKKLTSTMLVELAYALWKFKKYIKIYTPDLTRSKIRDLPYILLKGGENMDFYFALIFDYLKKNILTFIVIILSILNLIIGLNFKKLDNTSNDIEKTLSNSEELISNTLEEPKVTEAKETIRVDVKGMVKKAGVYELAKDSIVNDAIKKAGGLTSKADTTNVNLSKSLTNEMVIYIPKKEEVTKSTVNDALVDKSNSVGFIDNESSNETTNTTTKVNINTATLKDLITLNGIGESKAQAILEYRTKNGNFKTLEDLKKVSGIGEAAYEKIKDYICI